MTILLTALVATLWLVAMLLWLADSPRARVDVDRALASQDDVVTDTRSTGLAA